MFPKQRREVLGRLHLPNEPPLNSRGGPSRDAQVTNGAAHRDSLGHPVSPARRAGGEDRPPVRSQMQSEKDLPTAQRTQQKDVPLRLIKQVTPKDCYTVLHKTI